MSIGIVGPDPLRSGDAGLARRADEPEAVKPLKDVAPDQAADRVEISAQGRAMAELAEEAERLGMDPRKLALIKQRLVEGVYHNPTLADEVAARILKSGDLDLPLEV